MTQNHAKFELIGQRISVECSRLRYISVVILRGIFQMHQVCYHLEVKTLLRMSVVTLLSTPLIF